jgi:hypothetical protein
LLIFLTLTRLVVVFIFVNFSFALFTPPPLGDYHKVFTYVDDIVIPSKNKEDHLANLAGTFAKMRGVTLRLNLEKCVFGVQAKN